MGEGRAPARPMQTGRFFVNGALIAQSGTPTETAQTKSLSSHRPLANDNEDIARADRKTASNTAESGH